jgi:hypothetical protein
VAEAVPVVPQDLGPVAPQLVGAQQQLREIDDTRALALGLVFHVELDELLARGVARVLERGGAVPFVLVVIDEPLDFAWHPPGLVQLHGLHDLLDEPQLVLAVEDLEGLRQVRVAPVHAQQAVRDAMERAHPHRAARHT